MTSINSDFMSQLALRSLGKSSNMMTQAMERLSTGKRINSAADDAAACRSPLIRWHQFFSAKNWA